MKRDKRQKLEKLQDRLEPAEKIAGLLPIRTIQHIDDNTEAIEQTNIDLGEKLDGIAKAIQEKEVVEIKQEKVEINTPTADEIGKAVGKNIAPLFKDLPKGTKETIKETKTTIAERKAEPLWIAGAIKNFLKPLFSGLQKIIEGSEVSIVSKKAIKTILVDSTGKPVDLKKLGGGKATSERMIVRAPSDIHILDNNNNPVNVATETTLQAVANNTDGLEGAIGSTTDAEATNNGTLIAIAKRLRTILGTIDTSNTAISNAAGTTADADAGTGNGTIIALLKNLRTNLGQTTDSAATGNGSINGILKQIRGQTTLTAAGTGTTVDAEATGNGTIIAILKRIRTLLSSTLFITGSVSITGIAAVSGNVGRTNTSADETSSKYRDGADLDSTTYIEIDGGGKIGLNGFEFYNPEGNGDMYLLFFNMRGSHVTLGTDMPVFAYRIPDGGYKDHDYTFPINMLGEGYITVFANSKRDGTGSSPATPLEYTIRYTQ